MPGFQCLACPLGYTGTFEDAWAFNYTDRTFELYNLQRDEIPYQTCEDINECDSNNGGCDVNSYCVNTQGEYSNDVMCYVELLVHYELEINTLNLSYREGCDE